MPSAVASVATPRSDCRCQDFTCTPSTTTSKSTARSGVASSPMAPARPGSSRPSTSRPRRSSEAVGLVQGGECGGVRRLLGAARASGRDGPRAAWWSSVAAISKGSGAPPARSAARRSSGRVNGSRRGRPSRTEAGGAGGVPRSTLTITGPGARRRASPCDRTAVARTRPGPGPRGWRWGGRRRRPAELCSRATRVRASTTRDEARRSMPAMDSVSRSHSPRCFSSEAAATSWAFAASRRWAARSRTRSRMASAARPVQPLSWATSSLRVTSCSAIVRMSSPCSRS